MQNIVLTGLPGSGKTTLGRLLARRCGMRFVDLDECIAQMAGMPVEGIFAGYGEDFFRALESLAARRAAQECGQVIATGGGAVLRAENAAALRQNGLVVFVDRPLQAIAADIDCARRPLLRGGAAALESLAKQRRAQYLATAHYVLQNAESRDDALLRLCSLQKGLAAKGCALIGDPVAHSLSPRLHGALFAGRGVQLPYTAIRVPAGGLAAFMAGARASALVGLNVTIPHKQAVIPLLDGLDASARLAGAVNTVVREGDAWVGHNTDMDGLAKALALRGHGFAGRRVTLLGAGGAAMAAAAAAAANGAAALRVHARSTEKARAVCAQAQRAAPGIAVCPGNFTPPALQKAAADCNLLINATPLGMSGCGQDFETLDFLECLPPGTPVCDLVYAPPATPLLKRAAARGHPAINGLDMLACQAILAQALFLGCRPELDRLFPLARAALSPDEHNKEAAL